MDWTIIVTTLAPLAGVGLGVLLNGNAARRQAASTYRRETLQKIYTDYLTGFYDYQLVLTDELRAQLKTKVFDRGRVQLAVDSFRDLSVRSHGLTAIYDRSVPDYMMELAKTVGAMYGVLIQPGGVNELTWNAFASMAEDQGNELTTAMRKSLELEKPWWRRTSSSQPR